MTDNAFVYRHGRRFRELLALHAVKHILTPPYTPRWNYNRNRPHSSIGDRPPISRVHNLCRQDS